LDYKSRGGGSPERQRGNTTDHKHSHHKLDIWYYLITRPRTSLNLVSLMHLPSAFDIVTYTINLLSRNPQHKLRTEIKVPLDSFECLLVGYER
jgi:hypothetical protein